MYKLYNNYITKELVSIIKLNENNNGVLSIPFDPANTDYQQYLKWVEAGNQPEPAEETL